MQSDEADRVERKMRAFTRLNRKKPPENRAKPLYHIVDRYLPLSAAEKHNLRQRMETEKDKGVYEMLTRLEVDGIRKGKKRRFA